jgi:hypothetical protein
LNHLILGLLETQFFGGQRLQGAKRQTMTCETRHTSHVTRHTSHVTRQPSTVTRHTSHVCADSSLSPSHPKPRAQQQRGRRQCASGCRNSCLHCAQRGCGSGIGCRQQQHEQIIAFTSSSWRLCSLCCRPLPLQTH